MRLVKVSAETGLGRQVIQTAFDAGIESVSMHEVEKHGKDGGTKRCEVVDVETSTPRAKDFVDRLLSEDYYDPKKISFNTRQPRSIVSDRSVRELTVPLVEPSTDLYAELWQFSHMTYGLAGRVFISACLLAYGLIEAKTLLLIGGLLFLPLLPMVMAVSFGVAGSQWRLAAQGLFSFVISLALLMAGGAAVAAAAGPPMRSDDLIAPGVAILICAAVGVAAALASEDDAGRRELIGLAAASQIGMIPVMLGIGLVFGPPTTGPGLSARAVSLAANVTTIAVAMLITQYFTGVVGNIRRVNG